MSTHRYIDRVCCAALALVLAATALFMNGEALAVSAAVLLAGLAMARGFPRRRHG